MQGNFYHPVKTLNNKDELLINKYISVEIFHSTLFYSRLVEFVHTCVSEGRGSVGGHGGARSVSENAGFTERGLGRYQKTTR